MDEKFVLGEESAVAEGGQVLQSTDSYLFGTTVGEVSDLLGDGTITKELKQLGVGWSRPPPSALVHVHYICRSPSTSQTYIDTRVTHPNTGVSLELSGAAPSTSGEVAVPFAFSEAVKSMRRGEVAVFTTNSSVPFLPGNVAAAFPLDTLVEYEICLLNWAEDKDISPDTSGMVFLRTHTPGTGYIFPGLLDTVTINYRLSIMDGPVVQDWTLVTSVLDEIGGPEGLEVGIKAMSKGAEGYLTIHPDYAWGALGNAELGVPPNTWVTIEVQLLDHMEIKRHFALTMEERIEEANMFRLWGNDKYQNGEFLKALRRYEQALRVAEYDARMGADIKDPILLNIAQAHLKLLDPTEAIDYCERVLMHNGNSVKALYKRACAYIMKSMWDSAEEDLNRALQLDPGNVSVRKELVSLHEQKRAHTHALKQKYSTMFQKLSGFASEGRVDTVDAEEPMNLEEEFANSQETNMEM